jgi:hypothetical protein
VVKEKAAAAASAAWKMDGCENMNSASLMRRIEGSQYGRKQKSTSMYQEPRNLVHSRPRPWLRRQLPAYYVIPIYDASYVWSVISRASCLSSRTYYLQSLFTLDYSCTTLRLVVAATRRGDASMRKCMYVLAYHSSIITIYRRDLKWAS